MNLLATLRQRFAVAIASVAGEASSQLAEMVLPAGDARFGDYQANCAMPLGKRLGRPPREVAAEIVEHLDLAEFCEPPEIAGPGFINLRVQDSFLVAQLSAASRDTARLGIAAVESPRTLILDYSSPNVAKPMHVGHIRSTVIGDALYRVLRFLGHRTISDNHIGDWGTQFGMIIYGYKNFLHVESLRSDPVTELSRLYRFVNQLMEYEEARQATLPQLSQELAAARQRVQDLQQAPVPAEAPAVKKSRQALRQAETHVTELAARQARLEAQVAAVAADSELSQAAAEHPGIHEQVLQETAKLHAGDTQNRSLWQDFMAPCLSVINSTYDRLGVTFNHTLGESFYHDRLPDVIQRLQESGLARESDGAICVFLEGVDAPMIIRKKDGAFLYATTDLATLQYRMETFHPDAILYVVDHRQSLHFEQLFAVARLWGYADAELTHISFGTVLGEDGRPYKTRTGTAVGLSGLLDEAVERAHRIVTENDDKLPAPRLSEEERKQVAQRISLGAIKYADLAHNRTSDYVFSYDKMLAMHGNTATYMQYSYARVRSIFEKGGVDPGQLRAQHAAIQLGAPQERALALALLQLHEALERVAADYRPNHLTTYLYELASRYSEFFENCPVLKAPSEELRASRLLLCDLTARTLRVGLGLLGIDVVERM